MVSMIKHPVDIHIWLHHYLYTLHFSHIFIFIDNHPELYKQLQKYPSDKIYLYHSTNDIKKDKYLNLQLQQQIFINKILKLCYQLKIKYLFHVDDDELLVVSKKYDYSLKEFLRLQKQKYQKYTHLKIQNIEAIFDPSQTKYCLFSKYFIPCHKMKCKSYSNGKSIAYLSHSNIYSLGSHDFSGNSFKVDPSDILLLHFDSCSFQKWYQKFSILSNNISQKVFNSIPFDYYKTSIQKILKCNQQCQYDIDSCPSCQQHLYQYWYNNNFITLPMDSIFDLQSNNFYLENYYLKIK
jgi:hypothetical protein